MTEIDVRALDDAALVEYVTSRRWYGSKSREITHAQILEVVPLPRSTGEPLAVVALVEVRFHTGTRDAYQLVLGIRDADAGGTEDVVGRLDGSIAYEGLSDPAVARALVRLVRERAVAAGEEGELSFHETDRPAPQVEQGKVLPIRAEQSNSSVVLDDSLIMKVYRRLEAGINPELEVLRFLTARDFANVPVLHGWFEYAGRPVDATLGIVQQHVPRALDGWDFALDALRSDPERFLGRVRRLGEVTGLMHAALASDAGDPVFAPEDASGESLGLLVASVDSEVERVFLDLPDDVEMLEPIAGRGEEVRDQLRFLSHVGTGGRVLRTHGDYHLGQALWTGDDWVVIDFEGEPARSLSERRQKRSPLRDVAGMLRSFAYASSAAPLLLDVEAPADFEQRAREDFLAGYLAEVDASLLPAGEEAIDRLLTVFELEKAVYELRYELNNRPGWLAIPVAGIERLLSAGVP
jgi:trehalose synthase-fused probable maltokinase